MSKNLEVKVAKVAEIQAKFEAAQSAIFIDYMGLTVEEVTELRKQFREAGVDFVVLKNTLVKRACDALEIGGLDSYLAGPTAIAFGMTDAVAPAKIITEFIKKVKKTKVKCGLVDGKVFTEKEVEALASLPPKEVLIAKMMGSLNAPITNFVGVLSATLRSLVYALEAVRKQKGGE